MISNEELDKLYSDILSECKTLKDEILVLKKLDSEYKDDIRIKYCDNVLYSISHGYTKYDESDFEKNELIKAYLEIVKLLPEDCMYFQLTYNFFQGNSEKCLVILERLIDSMYNKVKSIIKTPEEFIDESLLIDMFFEPFKQAFDGFWSSLGTILKKYPTQEGIPELCNIIEMYYTCQSDEEALTILINTIQKFPKLILIKELMGYTYYSMKMWNNAIAYFESVEDSSIFFFNYDLYFMLAWSYGKIKEHKTEELYYRKALEINPNDINCLNNLGYSLYLQKKYSEAIGYFEKCLKIDSSYGYAANNYIRVLIALGRNKDAKLFVKSGKYKISRELIKRVEKLDKTNAITKKEIEKDFILSNEDEIYQKNTVDLGIKRQQFSNEKLLEDELTARIESGMDTFGLKLKIYKRKGVYGRQYIIPIGRLDLLCEDDEGNLYVIELKKDSGYDDAYKQTVSYVDWFERNDISKEKKVFGIICVNSPNKNLITQVHNDKRMKLFEYAISFREI